MRNVYFLLLILFIAGCGSADGDDDVDSYSELLQQEFENQDRAINGVGNYVVDIITDEDEVEKISRKIEKCQQEREGQDDWWLVDPNSLAGKYKAGDKKVVPEIVSVLKGPPSDEKSDLFWDLSPDYDQPGYTIPEPQIISAVFENINRGGEEEKKAIQLAGYAELKGWHDVFEKRLLTGKSADEGRLLFWMGYRGTSQRAVDYVSKKIKENHFSDDTLTDYLDGLLSFCSNGSNAVAAKSVELCYYVYDNKLIAESNFNSLRDSWGGDNPASPLLSIIFGYGDERSLPIAEKYYKRDVMADEALACMLRLDHKTHISKLYNQLEDESTFDNTLYLAADVYKQTQDKKIIEACIQNFEKHHPEPGTDYELESLMASLEEMDSLNMMRFIRTYATNKATVDQAEELQKYRLTTPQQVADFLLEYKLIDQPVDAKALAEIKLQRGSDAIYSVLELSKINHSFDAETGMVPCDYDFLIEDFFAISKGILDGAEVGMSALSFNDWETVEYEVMVVFKNKAYVIYPEDIGDWYDVPHVEQLLNTILDDNGITERFIAVISGDQVAQYIFGLPGAVDKLIEKYNLAYEE